MTAGAGGSPAAPPGAAVLDHLASLATAVERIASVVTGAAGPAAVEHLCGPAVAEHVRILAGQITQAQQQASRDAHHQAEEHKRAVMARRAELTAPATLGQLAARDDTEKRSGAGIYRQVPGQTLTGGFLAQRSVVTDPTGRPYSDHEGDGLAGRPRPPVPATAAPGHPAEGS